MLTRIQPKRLASVLLVACISMALIGGLTVRSVAATDAVTSLLKAFGIGYVVTKLGPQINDAVNTLTLNKNCKTKDSTKVVPIISLGTGAHIGAAQVSGSAGQVSKVAAVAQLEAEFSNRAFRTKALVPVNTVNPTQSIQRITGVGVSAIIDMTI